jgi:hypothetical protein
MYHWGRSGFQAIFCSIILPSDHCQVFYSIKRFDFVPDMPNGSIFASESTFQLYGESMKHLLSISS